jgi:tetratricopeptide (TPR) repeat protein
MILARSAGTQSPDDFPVSLGAVCGRWEACQAIFRRAGQAIRDGDYPRADRWLQHVERRWPEPYCHWAADQRRLLEEALNPEQVVRTTPDLPDFDDLFEGWEQSEHAQIPALTIDDPFAAPSVRPRLSQLAKPPLVPLPEAPKTLTLRLARVCRGLRDYRSAADLYVRGIDTGELPAGAVLTELLDCLSRCGAEDDEFTRLARLAALEGTFDRFERTFDIALRHRDTLLRPALRAGDRQMELEISAGRNPTAGRDRLEFLQRFRPLARTEMERVRLYNAMSQAMRQIGDDDACRAWEEKLLAEFPRFVDEGTAVLNRRGERLLAAGNPAAAIVEFRQAARLAPWTSGGQKSRYELGALLQRRGNFRAAIAEFTRLVPPPMIDGEEGELTVNPLSDGGLAAALRISECHESLGEIRSALAWAERAVAIETADGLLQGNWLTPAGQRTSALRQKLDAGR